MERKVYEVLVTFQWAFLKWNMWHWGVDWASALSLSYIPALGI